jgi:chemosensory pili system protein ChpA (sensor histidine kinase/response regulator)
MITSDQEQQVKLQFLEEATDYLDTIESGLLGLGNGAVTGKQLDALLRAAHSIKGGAAMMGYTTLSGLGHHLEDYFKIIQYGKAAKPDAQVEQLMLGTIDCLRQIVAVNRQGRDVEATWLAERVTPLFDQLRDKLGDFNPEDEANMLASESGEDIHTFLFENEVERCLTDLEATVSGNPSGLYDNLLVCAEELGGLAEMLELPALVSLCQSVLTHLNAQPHQVNAIADLAISAWRRTQAMVLIGQTGNLPIEIELPGSGIMAIGQLAQLPSAVINREELAGADDQPFDFADFEIFDEPAVVTQQQDNRLPAFIDLDDEVAINIQELEPVEVNPSANEPSVLAEDPFADFSISAPTPFSTITASDDLEESIFVVNNDEIDLENVHQNTIANEVINSDPHAIHFQPTLSSEDEEKEDKNVDTFALERLDLSSDLSFDTEDPDLASAMTGLSGFLDEMKADDILSSAVLNIKPTDRLAPKQNALDQEVADLLRALDQAPEVPGEVHHISSNSPSEQREPAAGEAKRDQAPVADRTIRVATKQLEEIGDLFGELTIDRNGLNLHLQGMRQLVASLHLKVQQLEQSNARLREAYEAKRVVFDDRTSSQVPNPVLGDTDTWEQTQPGESSEFTSHFDLLEFDRYSDTHLLSQEVMDTVVQIEEITTDLDLQLNDTERTTRDLNRTAKQLQTGLTQVRMRPISDLFNRFPRAIRTLSVQHSKPVDLKFKGGTTLIERSILEALNDPLMHLVRNAFDHGIEPSAARRASGKSDTGTIEIGANYRGNQTIITIKDDGGGIDLDKIRAKVLKMGIGAAEVATYTDKELTDLIFEPGFSTAAKVTDLSGRGVGMDVVRTNIQSLRGDVFVDTKLGKGTTFTITVPFTLSVVRVLLVEVNGLWLAIPSNIVEEIILLNPAQIISTAGQKMLQWEEFTVRLIQPAEFLHLPYLNSQVATSNLPTIDCPTVLMIDQGQDIVALEVDKFWGEQEVTIRQPQGNIKLPPGFTGCTILGDGRIVPLVDAIELIRWIDGDVTAPATTSHKTMSSMLENVANIPNFTPAAPMQRSRVLVVDDSINVRRFVALTLEKAGYLVEQAKDGLEAIEKLQAGLSTQAVVCDIEMPRMDGYGFLTTIKGQPQFKNIPVLMLTSRSGDKHRKIAMNLGANGYFSKPFKEQELLATLTQLIGK